ncbi:DUF6177 family protein [Streptomyces sp. H10-C2]|uniref:DUF6177 family protein n=1 Tax=unclassified Streptomyces TaxID=2593676 RepID=UPI0024BA3283|nr:MULTISPECIES: DUF6177 family protein [unclassified Streptomyces]MDJ0345617.1 DUF6177 family protein [Streptomyces sp. PH10-H1]MDJ0372982.1 DUF6177 family protein [Streptomyces sp. H10-C2]
MTKDVIALTPKMPDTWTLLAGLYAGGPGLDVSSTHDGAVIQLCTPGGRPLVCVEAPLLVQVPGEAERLLGVRPANGDGPYWWTEARASTATPGAERLAGSVIGRLTALLGGITWPAGAATTGVVHITGTEDPTVTAHPMPSAHSAVDVLTDTTAVVLADRPVIALTSWLSDILRTVATTERSLQIVTPPHVRLSLPLRTALTGAPNRWVVQDPDCGYYDGLSGAVLRWQDGTFAPAPTAGTAHAESGEPPVAEAFSGPALTSERQLIVSFRTLHEPDTNLVLGRALRTAWTTLTGSPPAGWSTAEPINLPWSEGQLTALARDRAPEPTQLLAVGHPNRPALATTRITRTTAGVAEDTVLTLGYNADESPPLDALEPLARALVTDHGLTAMLASLRRARRDLSVPPHFEAPPIPLSLTLGARDVRDIGLAHARRPPVNLQPSQLGPPSYPALHYSLGDGTNAQAWTTFQHLMDHLNRS